MRTDALVIGAGPGGLAAAEALLAAGHTPVIAEAKPSPARKFLMAGKSGLNLTKDEPEPAFVSAYSDGSDALAESLAAFGPEAVQDWARGLGQAVFTGSTGRVFPKAMKASPLLRAWLARLDAGGADLRRRWRWTGWDGTAARFDTPEGPVSVAAGTTVLALGGGSWARLGSDGAWAEILAADSQPVLPFAPSNTGLAVSWSPHMTRHFGTPVKGARLSAGSSDSRGEFIVSKHGVEGGGIYAMSRAIRSGAPLVLDLAPDLSAEEITTRMRKAGAKQSLSNRLRKALKFEAVKTALLQEWARPLPQGAALAARIKALPVRHDGFRPIDEAISTTGGLSWEALDAALMLKARPGTFCAGEMIAWDAPTGGYLITGCLATGFRAGQGAAAWLNRAVA
ncbi:MAG: TIGR03862 family flavoprotein [Pseudomonadota bacterium]